jgi:two-component system, OmpR family, response regulator
MTPEGREQVLFVEDEPLLRETIAAALAEEGFAVVEAASGERALALIRELGQQIDWLFTDVCLPGTIDGWHVAFEFRFLHPLRPIIFATGFGSTPAASVAGSVVLPKPYSVDEVVAAMRGLSGTA